MADPRNEDLLESLYEAIVDPKKWAAFFSRLCQITAAVTLGAIDHDVRAESEVEGIVATEIRYDRNASTPPSAGRPVRGRVHIQRRNHRNRDEAANEFAGRWREAAARSGVDRVTVVELPEGSIAACRPAAEWTEEEKRFLAELLPHLLRALRLHVRMAEVVAAERGAVDVLDHLPFGVVLLDSEARVISSNRRATELIGEQDSLQLAGDALRPADGNDGVVFDLVVRAACGIDGTRRIGGAVALGRPRRRALSMIAIPLSDNAPTGSRLPVAMLVLADPDLESEQPVAQLADLYRLTSAEARIASLLTTGRTLEEVSVELGITVHTARTHLKRVLAKTDTTRQADLVRLILRVVPVRVPPAAKKPGRRTTT